MGNITQYPIPRNMLVTTAVDETVVDMFKGVVVACVKLFSYVPYVQKTENTVSCSCY